MTTKTRFSGGRGGSDPLPRGYGDGWLGRDAADVMRIAIQLGGYDRQSLLEAVARRGGRLDSVYAALDQQMGELPPLSPT